MRGDEPNNFQSFLYSFVEFLTLNGIIIKLTRKNLITLGISITLPSFKNSFKNFHTENIVGFSGDPRLIIKTAFFIYELIQSLGMICLYSFSSSEFGIGFQLYFHDVRGGSDINIDSILPLVSRPNKVPLSYTRLNSTYRPLLYS